MKHINHTILLSGLLIFALAAENSLCIAPSDTLRNEIGEIIQVSPLGEPGVDYLDLQFIASFKPGFLTIPDGKSEEYLKDCQVEANLFSLLEQNSVYYVKKVFKQYKPGDTIRVIESDTCFVPDLSQVYLFLQNEGVSVADAVDSMYLHEATLYAEPNFIRTTTRIPDDPQWYYQWNLQTPDNVTSFGIGCPTAWDGTVGDRTLKLAIIDTGINHLNEDLGFFSGQDVRWPADTIMLMTIIILWTTMATVPNVQV